MSIYSEGGWKIFCKIPRQTVGNFPIIVERSFSADTPKGITEITSQIRSKNDETKHKLRNLRRIITRNRQENSWLFGIKKQAGKGTLGDTFGTR